MACYSDFLLLQLYTCMMQVLTGIVLLLTAISIVPCEGFCKGLQYRNKIISCIGDIIENHFIIDSEIKTVVHTILLDNITNSALSGIENEIIKRIISSSSRATFTIILPFAPRAPVGKITKYPSQFYIIILEKTTNFESILNAAKKIKNFNFNALFIIYLEEGNVEDRNKILTVMKKNFLYFVYVFTPKEENNFDLFKLKFHVKPRQLCTAFPELDFTDQCINGVMSEAYVKYNKQSNLRRNCTLNVVAKQSEPFVINENEGFEIDVLKSISSKMKINFNITFVSKEEKHWGSKINGSYTGLAKLIYEDWYIGVGNIDTGLKGPDDFDYSRMYRMETINWIVPRAKRVPRWRTLFAIFSPQIWGICALIAVMFGAGFYFTLKYETGQVPKKSLLTAFQVLLYQPVDNLPRKDLHNLLFLGLCIFSIILCSVYSSFLLYYYNNPMYEYQISKYDDLFDINDNTKYHIGALNKFKIAWNNSESRRRRSIFNNFITLSEEEETIDYWLKYVGDSGNTWTLAGKAYTQYIGALDSNLTRNKDGTSKIYIIKKPNRHYTISLMFRKAYPFIDNINTVINNMSSGGLFDYYWSKYNRLILKQEGLDLAVDSVVDALQLQDVQGAFVFLMLGYICAFIALILEILLKKAERIKLKKKWKKAKILKKFKIR